MAKRVKKKTHKIRTFLVSVILVGIMTAAICGVAFAWYVRTYIQPEAEVDIEALGMNLTSFVYAKDPDTGEFVEYEQLHGTENRIWADYTGRKPEMGQIPKEMADAIVAIEDQRFYEHQGVDWKRTMHAAAGYLTGSGSFGGSTITQQLIKNMTKDDDYSVKRKINEIFRALALEKRLDDKDRILELYMNMVYFGGGSWGVQAAAHHYFNKDISQLSLPECALIAGITNRPTGYNPYLHPEAAKERQTLILNEMCKQGMITESERNTAIATPLHYERPANEQALMTPMSYFSEVVYNDVLNDLMEKKGYSEQVAKTLIVTGGLQIYATIDQNVQKVMDDVYTNDSNFPDISKNGERPQSAMVVLRPDGSIAGIVGGRGVKTGSLGWNNATLAKRQPGSSIKPVSVYGPAMDAGVITPYTGVVDEPYTQIDGKDWPRNDNHRYQGPMILKDAVAHSINTIAVKTLAELTPEKSYEFMTQKLGITSLIGSRTESNGNVVSDVNLAALGLGGLTDGVSVLEVAGAYTIFVNQGTWYKPHSYSLVKDANGTILLSNETPETTIAFENEKTAYYMNETLKGVVEYGTGTRAKISGMDTAGKTGTTTANRDRWFCGYTPYYVGACWFGYESNYKISGLGYTNPALNLWKKVMSQIHEGLPNAEFPKPGDGFKKVSYCTVTGLLPNAGCKTATGYFYEGDVPTETCHGHGGGELTPTDTPPDTKTNIVGSDTDPETGLPNTKPDHEGGTPSDSGSSSGTVTPPDSGTVTPPEPDTPPSGGEVVEPPEPAPVEPTPTPEPEPTPEPISPPPAPDTPIDPEG